MKFLCDEKTLGARRVCEGSEFSDNPGQSEKVIKYHSDEKTLAACRGFGGSEFANSPGRIEKVINFPGEKKTLAACRVCRNRYFHFFMHVL